MNNIFLLCKQIIYSQAFNDILNEKKLNFIFKYFNILLLLYMFKNLEWDNYIGIKNRSV